MNKEEARTIAERLVSETDFKKYSAKFAEVRELDHYPGSWTVIFDIIGPNGSVLDAPTVVVVDRKTAKARFLPSW